MGFKTLFKIKPPEDTAPEKNREDLNELGIATKGDLSVRKLKFAAYGKFAGDRRQEKVHAPAGYEQYASGSKSATVGGSTTRIDKQEADLDSLNAAPFDPYAVNSEQIRDSRTNPYSMVQANAMSSNSAGASASNNPYGYHNPCSSPHMPMNRQQSGNSGGGGSGVNPYKNMGSDIYRSQESTMAASKGGTPGPYDGAKHEGYRPSSLNEVENHYQQHPQHGLQQRGGRMNNNGNYGAAHNPSNDVYSRGTSRTNDRSTKDNGNDELDFNETIDTSNNDDDLNNSIHDGEIARGYQTFEEIQREQLQKQQQEEDEEVDEIKQQIRFTKQSSVASTRNTLKMAQDAEMAGMNTLGMLGNQSEKLHNVERNMNLMKMQNRVAEDKVGELKKLNRSILAVHIGNPFTSKRRVREAEERIKSQKLADKMLQEETNAKLNQSTNRIENAMNGPSEYGVREKYQRQQALDRAKRYQFENDEEDDEMEAELDRNLDKIGQVSGRLKKLAIAAGQEIDSQKDRIAKIEDNADDLDIRIHLNTNRLTNIR